MQRVAIIDLGSNSARLVIVRIYNNLSNHLIYSQKTSLRLSQRMSKEGEILPEAADDIVHTIKNFAHMCELFKATKITGVATAAMRSAKNGSEIIARIKKETNIDMKIVSGEEEAALGYLGVVNSIDEKDALLFDLGGGSIELVLIRNRKAEKLASLPTGSTNMTQKFGMNDKVSEESFKKLAAYMNKKLKEFPWLKDSGLPVIGIGGTARNIAKIYQRRVQYLYPKLHNYRMDASQFNEVFFSLKGTSCEQRRKIPGLNSERADIIMAGATIINTLIQTVGSKELIISGCGLRDGLFYDHYFEQLGKPKVLENILDFSVGNLLKFALEGVEHAQKVVELSEKMFIGWQDIHRMGPSELKILRVAAKLHDIGISINYYDHPRHSAYLVENAPLMGLTHREQILAALIVSWHNGVTLKHTRYKVYRDFLSEEDWEMARKLALILGMAENLDFTETGAVREIYPSVRANGKAVLSVTAKANHDIEISELKNDLSWFKKEFKSELQLKSLSK